jgi:hypothetical protein
MMFMGSWVIPPPLGNWAIRSEYTCKASYDSAYWVQRHSWEIHSAEWQSAKQYINYGTTIGYVLFVESHSAKSHSAKSHSAKSHSAQFYYTDCYRNV